jgi:methylglyoxal synthase
MIENTVELPKQKRIALIAHDSSKPDLLAWVKYNLGTLGEHQLFATGTTGSMLSESTGLEIFQFKSGPFGGDQQIGAHIADGGIDFLIFFWDPLEPQPHDPDIKALLRLAVLYNIPTACNRATADFLISSPFMNSSYKRIINQYDSQLKRIYIQEDGNSQ